MSVNEVVIAYHMLQKISALKRKHLWAYSFYINNVGHSVNVVGRDLSIDPELFQSYYQMSQNSFGYIVLLISHAVHEKDANYRLPVSPEEQLFH
jgi:hypothetical protein